jgi:hypothetical protein
VFWHRFTGGTDDLLNSDRWQTSAFPATEGTQMWMQALTMNVDGQFGDDLILASKSQGATVGWLQAPEKPEDLAAWQYHKLRDAPAGSCRSRCRTWMQMAMPTCCSPTAKDRATASSGSPIPARRPRAIRLPGKEHVIGAQGREVMFADIADMNGDGLLDVVGPP